MNRKYTKPVVKDLGEAAISSGSCLSGGGETQMANCSVTGGNALISCGGGSNPLAFVPCTDGGSAGGGCVNGSNAG